jgi:hypothetical protein
VHVLLKNPALEGWEYGMLRSFEAAIVRQLEATCIDIFDNTGTRWVDARLSPGTRWDKLRRFVPKRPLKLPEDAETVWLVLMGPENYSLDLFSDWQNSGAKRILYLFDTLPAQIPRLQRLVRKGEWDICVTSFNDAVPLLETATGRRWFHVDQGIPSDLFVPPLPGERVIHFSAYGRRNQSIHNATLEFCRQRDLYYDFTTHDRSQPTASSLQLYRQYAWHLSHSQFTFSWPLEMTNPARACGLSPITCRWFEAAAAGTVIVGKPPKNPHFAEVFGNDVVVQLDVEATTESILKRLDEIWENRLEHFKRAEQRRAKLNGSIDWSARVDAILSLSAPKRL